jgi:hypothetical protein
VKRALLAISLASCSTYPSSSSSSSSIDEAPAWTKPGVRVLDADDAIEAFAGPATFTVRAVSSGAVERVVAVPGVGEIHVGLAGDDDACRFVWSKGGLDRLVLYSARACAKRSSDGRVCFKQSTFTADARDESAPHALLVDGCADENDLLWSKVDGAQPATIGPTAFRQRCARLPKKKGCELTYLKRDSVAVASNPAADQGFTFVFDGDGWRACFLEKEAGDYRVLLDVEDACGGARKALELKGNSMELDD